MFKSSSETILPLSLLLPRSLTGCFEEAQRRRAADFGSRPTVDSEHITIERDGASLMRSGRGSRWKPNTRNWLRLFRHSLPFLLPPSPGPRGASVGFPAGRLIVCCSPVAGQLQSCVPSAINRATYLVSLSTPMPDVLA